MHCSLTCTYMKCQNFATNLDLLVLLTALSQSANVYFMKSGKGKVPQQMYSLSGVENTAAKTILFLHALSGCDSTYPIFGHGTTKSIKVPRFDFSGSADSDSDLYGCKDETTTLISVRFHCFIRTMYHSKHSLASLPSTEAAAEQHSLRTYRQVPL